MTLFSSRMTLAAAACIFASGVAAQDFCAGQGAGGQWIGGGEAASDITTADSHREQMALVLSGNAYVSVFSLSSPTDVRVEAAGRGNGDPAIDIYDSAGNLIMSDDDSGGNGAARAEMSLEPGTYCMSMVSYDGSPMTAFVRIGRTEQEALTAGASETSEPTSTADDGPAASGACADGQSLGTLNGPLMGEGSVRSNPVWRFTLDAPSALSITAENEDADPTLALLDANNDVLAENDDFDGLNSRIEVTTDLAPGEYCLQVGALTDEGLPIAVTVDTYDPQAALEALYARGEAAPPMGGPVAISDLGVLDNRLRQDVPITTDAQWFSMDVPEGGLVVIEAIGAGGSVDPWLAVYDDLGRQVGLNDDANDTLDAMVMTRVSRGSYLIALKQVGDGQGFVRLVMERFVPAP